MKYICAQPATLYYAWQIDVMLFSFRAVGVNLSDVHIVCAIHNEIHPMYEKLKAKYPEVLFSFYEDTRLRREYISSIRPHILKKHFTKYPELSESVFMYHDCDIALTKPLDVDHYLRNGIDYLSDTLSYIGYDYIKSKGQEFVDQMTDIVGIDEETVRDNQKSSGGAQYLLKPGIDKYFWHDVEKDSVNLFVNITELNKETKSKNPEFHEIQIWCADMWAVLWNIWKRNRKTEVVKEMDFNWSVTSAEFWNDNAIYHNAGVTSNHEGFFYKGVYMDEVPPLDLKVDPGTCSYMYYELYKMATG